MRTPSASATMSSAPPTNPAASSPMRRADGSSPSVANGLRSQRRNAAVTPSTIAVIRAGCATENTPGVRYSGEQTTRKSNARRTAIDRAVAAGGEAGIEVVVMVLEYEARGASVSRLLTPEGDGSI